MSQELGVMLLSKGRVRWVSELHSNEKGLCFSCLFILFELTKCWVMSICFDEGFFTLFINSKVYRSEKNPHRDTRNNSVPVSWISSSSQVDVEC